MTLYSDIYHTGDSVTFTDDVADLSPWNFAHRLVSLKVEGPCSWTLFDGEKQIINK